MASDGLDIVCIDTTAGFLDSGGFYQKAMITVGEIEPIGVWDMIAKVMREAGSSKIRTLTIHGHGSPGAQGVANSHSCDDTGKYFLRVNATGDLVGDGRFIARLGPYFKPGGRIHLGGCNVARGESGADLLLAVSQAVRRNGSSILTFASESWQNPWLPGYEGINGDMVRYSDGDHVLYTQYTGMD